MNKEEFIRGKRAADDRARTNERAGGIIFFAGLIALFAFAKWQEGHRSLVPAWTIPCLLILFFAAAIAGAPNSHWRVRRRARRNGLICPSCAGALFGPAGEIAIASGNCAHCGETVFQEEDTGAVREEVCATGADSSREPVRALESGGLECPWTREEFQLRERATYGKSRSLLLFVLVLISVLAITSSVLLPKLKANPAMGRPFAIGMLLTFASFYAAIFILGSRQKRRIREYGLACPGCRGRLTGLASSLAKATGCCSHCGERLFLDVPFQSAESLEKRKDFAERKRTVDRGWRSVLVVLIPVAVLGLGMIVGACVFVPTTGEFLGVPLANVQTGMIVGSLVLIYGTGIPIFLRMHRRRRDNGLGCLSCSKPLTLVPAEIAVATGICSHCGSSIFGGKA